MTRQPDTLPATIYTPNGVQHYDYIVSPADYDRMDQALEEAQRALDAGDSPIGSMLVTPNNVYPTRTTEFSDNDLFGHAEMNGVKAARTEVGRDLSKCILYTTAEPCVGCSYILDKGQLGMLVIAASRDDAPEFFRKRDITLDTIWSKSRRTLTVVKGLRVVEAASLLTASTKRH